jgi:hypothetical protein
LRRDLEIVSRIPPNTTASVVAPAREAFSIVSRARRVCVRFERDSAPLLLRSRLIQRISNSRR